MDELRRIEQRYRERDADPAFARRWSLHDAAVLHAAQERERRVLALMREAGVGLEGRAVLDVGCGRGTEFANLLRWGASADALVGIDLMHARLIEARRHGGTALVQASATHLPFANDSFDVVVQNVVFSSIVDATTRRTCAAEMLRVLRPGGWLLWYDAFRSRARDPHFRTVSRAEVEALFPGVAWRFVRLTSDIGLTSRLQRWLGSWSIALLDASGVARTHLLGLGRLTASGAVPPRDARSAGEPAS